ncbi:MAG TPA: tannase/feruloyl esterase family alpha/beta hydrolase [Roseateles sp.]|uniref:tannase/feruloyl esterase family alpha/beta hydrolase n=1 Tax=Roseateles sp. TaxID=1971397 RepID=UPI002ED9F82E
MGIVLEAKSVKAGEELSLEGAKSNPAAPFAFCRVTAKLASEPGSEIHSEVWLPEPKSWNGKFVGLGNGGYGGVIPAMHMVPPLRSGYAVAATDMGHGASFPKLLATTNAKWAHEDPIKLKDWAHRANHLTAVAGKELLARYTGQQPKRSYFHGCSDGGREALMQAGRYPDDYDGIVAGAPAAAFTDLMSQGAWNNRQAAQTKLLEDKLRALHNAVLAKCDALDGVKDGLIENPAACTFDPAPLQCKDDDGKQCLSKTEVDAVRAIYQGPRLRDGTQFSRGFSPGSEYVEGWSLWITGPALPLVGTVKSMTGGGMISTDFFRWMVFGDSSWKSEKLDLDADLARARQKLSALINSNELDMSAFFKRDNKLLLYHGWADAALPAMNTIDYYDKLRGRHGEAASLRSRLFMAPGMGHCGGGPGPNVFDPVAALDQWMESGVAPERIVASKYDNDQAPPLGLPAKLQRSRPLCPWPKLARWDGKGSIDIADSFSCEAPAAP